MGRLARAIATGWPHHVTQRGNYGQKVFKTDGDRQAYLDWLVECSGRHGLEVLAYCLMANHVHMVVVPELDDSLARCLAQVHMRYSQRINRRRGRPGHLWQGRFFSCILDQAHLWAAVRYVERNPVRAGLVKLAQDYPWSSAAGHCGLRKDPLLSGDLELADHVGDWAVWLGQDEDQDLVQRLRIKTQTGRPCGNERFVSKMEKLLGRTLAPKPPGRPKKKTKKTKTSRRGEARRSPTARSAETRARRSTAKKHRKKTKK